MSLRDTRRVDGRPSPSMGEGERFKLGISTCEVNGANKDTHVNAGNGGALSILTGKAGGLRNQSSGLTPRRRRAAPSPTARR